MTKYIPLDALLAEIERLFEKAGNSLGEYRNGAEHTLISIKDFLDTLEVKEVDLTKQISFQWSKFCLYDKDKDSFVKVARFFFELGLKAQKRE